MIIGRSQGESLGIADARVYSTYALNDEEKEAVAREFGGRVNKKIRIENIVDPTLLGGLKVAIGDTIYMTAAWLASSNVLSSLLTDKHSRLG